MVAPRIAEKNQWSETRLKNCRNERNDPRRKGVALKRGVRVPSCRNERNDPRREGVAFIECHALAAWLVAVLLVLGMFAAVPGRVLAWSYEGHHAIARFAWKQLDDQQKLAIVKILKAHPHYDIYLKVGCPKDVSEGEWA